MNPVKSKTNITLAITAVVNLFYQLNQSNAWFVLPENFIEIANTILISLAGVFMRQGIAKSGPEGTEPNNNIAQKGP